jgi:hypothetical protein
MSERRTFIVRIHSADGLPIVEDVATGERVRLPGLASIPDELRRRLETGPDDVAADRRHVARVRREPRP